MDPGGFVEAAEPVSLAVVGLAADGSADYGFHVLGAADWQWTDDELAARPARHDGDPARRVDLQLDRARAPTRSPGWSTGCTPRAAPDQRRPQHPADARRGAGRREPRQHRRGRAAAARPAGRAAPTSSRSAPRTSPGWSRADAADLDAAAPPGPRAGPPRAAHRRRRAAADRPPRPRRPALAIRRVTVADTVGAGDSLAAGLLSGLLDDRRHHAGGAGGPADDDLLRPGRRRRAGRRAELHPRRGRSAHAAPSSTPPARPGDRELRLVGFEELSATVVRDRLLARRAEFWAGTALDDAGRAALHDPRVLPPARRLRRASPCTADDEDAGYLLGVVSADRLAVVHAARRASRPAPERAWPRRLRRAVRRPGGRRRARERSRRSPRPDDAAGAGARRERFGGRGHRLPGTPGPARTGCC